MDLPEDLSRLNEVDGQSSAIPNCCKLPHSPGMRWLDKAAIRAPTKIMMSISSSRMDHSSQEISLHTLPHSAADDFEQGNLIEQGNLALGPPGDTKQPMPEPPEEKKQPMPEQDLCAGSNQQTPTTSSTSVCSLLLLPPWTQGITLTHVEEVKILCCLLPFVVTSLLNSMIFNNVFTLFISQGALR